MIAFLLSPVARWLAGALAILALGWFIYAKGYSAAEEKCDAASLRAQIATLERDLRIAKSAAADAERRAAVLDETLKANQDQINDYEAELAKRPDPQCGLTGDDVRRLQNLKH